MELFRKAIYFDLDTKELKNHFTDITKAYYKLRKDLKEKGFSHRQGSGYVSLLPLTITQAYEIVASVAEQNKWLSQSITKIDIMDVGDEFDATEFVQELNANQTL